MYHPSQITTVANAHERDLMKMAQRARRNKRDLRKFRNIRTNLVVFIASLKA